MRRQLQAESKENKKRNRVCACGRKERKKKKKKKSLYSAGVSEGESWMFIVKQSMTEQCKSINFLLVFVKHNSDQEMALEGEKKWISCLNDGVQIHVQKLEI